PSPQLLLRRKSVAHSQFQRRQSPLLPSSVILAIELQGRCFAFAGSPSLITVERRQSPPAAVALSSGQSLLHLPRNFLCNWTSGAAPRRVTTFAGGRCDSPG
ncbi:unnamed protein product, partial [Cuscuta campestris]